MSWWVESKLEKVGKLENCKIDEQMWCQSEEKLCKSIFLARRNREGHAMLAEVEEEQEQDVICFDDITGRTAVARSAQSS